MLPDRPYHLRRAARLVRAGGVVAYPTEGVWGLGCDPWDRAAVERILAIKRRPVDKGLILIGADFAQLAPWLAPLPADQQARLDASWPGPFTWVIRHSGRLPPWVTGGRPTLAVRVPDHPLARELCRRAGRPLVSTSANRSGRPALTEQWRVRLQLGADLDGLLPGRVLTPGESSRIRDLASGELLRP